MCCGDKEEEEMNVEIETNRIAIVLQLRLKAIKLQSELCNLCKY